MIDKMRLSRQAITLFNLRRAAVGNHCFAILLQRTAAVGSHCFAILLQRMQRTIQREVSNAAN
jgi:hypothetical protein